MAETAGFGTFAYGTEIQTVCPSKWKTLRTKACQAIGASQSVASPRIAMLCQRASLDPQLRHLSRMMIFWRRLFKVFPECNDGFNRLLACSNLQTRPVFAFRYSCRAACWEPMQDFVLRHQNGSACNWLLSQKSGCNFALGKHGLSQLHRIVRTVKILTWLKLTNDWFELS